LVEKSLRQDLQVGCGMVVLAASMDADGAIAAADADLVAGLR